MVSSWLGCTLSPERDGLEACKDYGTVYIFVDHNGSRIRSVPRLDIYQERQEVAGKSVRIMDRNEQKERDKLFRQSLGKFFIDLSKLVFAGVVVGGVVQLSNSSNLAFSVIMILFGLVASSFLAYVGFLILR